MTEAATLDGLVEQILKSELGQPLENFLASRTKNSCIVSAPSLCELILSKHGDCAATWLPLDAEIERSKVQGRNVFVVGGERTLEHRLADQAKSMGSARSLTFLDDILPSLVTRSAIFAEHSDTTRRYALLSIPRTGSTYLCALLANRGLGVPLEHIRDPAAKTVNGDPANFDQLLAGLEKYGSKKGVFGTKLISHFLLAAANENIGTATRLIEVLQQRDYVLMCLYRNFIDCLVSNLIANKLGTWHIYDAEGAKRLRNRSDALDMDKAFVFKHFIDMAVQKIALDVTTRDLCTTNIDYDELLKDPDEVLDRVSKALDLPLEDSGSQAVPVPESTREQVHFYQPVKDRLLTMVRSDRTNLRSRIEERVFRFLENGQKPYASEQIERSLGEFGLKA
jgi:LPS sulfotransferase NodH